MAAKNDSTITQKIIVIAILFVLFGSVIAFSLLYYSPNSGAAQNSFSYGGSEFFRTESGVSTDFEGQLIEFFFYPEDLSNTDASLIVEKLRSSQFIYATSRPSDEFADLISEAEFNVGRIIGSKRSAILEVAFTVPNDFGKPVITCENATLAVPVILFNSTNGTTGVSENRNCIVVNFESEIEFYKIRDKVVYELIKP